MALPTHRIGGLLLVSLHTNWKEAPASLAGGNAPYDICAMSFEMEINEPADSSAVLDCLFTCPRHGSEYQVHVQVLLSGIKGRVMNRCTRGVGARVSLPHCSGTKTYSVHGEHRPDIRFAVCDARSPAEPRRVPIGPLLQYFRLATWRR
jgi:hypothetical protein